MPGLTIEGVTHRYGTLVAIDSVDLAIQPGETVCLLGPSGCGKSTLLRLAAGLERLQSGRIAIGGQVVATGGSHRHVQPEARGVGLMFQDFALFPHLTVAENIRYGLAGNRAAMDARVRGSLSELGMEGLADRYPHALSGGQQQRVALLRALAPRPRVMLLDEPFSTLDEHLRHEVRMEAMNLLARGGAVTLIVTHDAEEAMLLADRIAVMRDGRIVQDGTPPEVYARPVDLFTARLFGPVNRYEGTVRNEAVATPVGAVAAPGLAESTRVEVAVRAVGIELPPEEEVRADSMWGRVRTVRRLGGATHVLMTPRDSNREARGAGGNRGGEGGGVLIEARLSGSPPLMEGEVRALRPRLEHCFVFPLPGGRGTCPERGGGLHREPGDSTRAIRGRSS